MEKDEGPALVTAPARYLVLVVTTAREAAEAVAAVLHSVPAGGVVEDEAPEGMVRLRAYLREDVSSPGMLADLKRRLDVLPTFGLGTAPPDLVVERAVDESWATVWKAHFHAFPVGRRLWVVPTWEDPDLPPDAVSIRLDPGMAFGSGLHPSTQLCLRWVEAHLRPGERVTDVGTGSGILAIAAAKLGAASVVAVDHDPVAVDVARANVAQNGVAGRVTVVRGHLLEEVRTPVDVLLANLTAEVVMEMAPAVTGCLAAGGRVVASGIAAPRLDEVCAAFARAGLAVEAVEADEEWRAVVAQTRGAAEAADGGGESRDGRDQ